MKALVSVSQNLSNLQHIGVVIPDGDEELSIQPTCPSLAANISLFKVLQKWIEGHLHLVGIFSLDFLTFVQALQNQRKTLH